MNLTIVGGHKEIMEASEYRHETESGADIIHELARGILGWYDFKYGASALYVGRGDSPVREMLEDSGLVVVEMGADMLASAEEGREVDDGAGYDYIIITQELETLPSPEKAMLNARRLLVQGGRLLLTLNNRFGIRYFCGDRDIYTQRNFDGIEGYRRAYSKPGDTFRGKCMSRAEIGTMLSAAGFGRHKFYSVFPCLEEPAVIYADGMLPSEDPEIRSFPSYNFPGTLFLEEEPLYKSLAENGMFHIMANAYLIECVPEGDLSDVRQVTCSMDRGRTNAMYTIIHESGKAEKRAAYPEGCVSLERLASNMEALRAAGIPTVETKIENRICVMPYINAESGQVYLKRLLVKDKDRFIKEMDRFRGLILSASEKDEISEEEGAVLSRGYLDMIPLNSFYVNGEFVFYDQEFMEEHYPANVTIQRLVDSFPYEAIGDYEMRDRLYERYGLNKRLKHWQELAWKFTAELRNEEALAEYHEEHRRNPDIVNANRQRMNYSEDDYRRLFIDIFDNADTRKLVLFGSGKFAEKFVALYGNDYPPYAIVDNNKSAWGKKLGGVEIKPPAILEGFSSGEYKVIICIKNYLSVAKQLDRMGIHSYSIYDAGKAYPKKNFGMARVTRLEPEIGKERTKRYHTGYVAGVFDMFHAGHVNLLRKAKEQCEYLIVGVVPDELAYRQKGKYPVISCEDRVEVVKACRYADMVEVLPLNYGGIRDAYRLYGFDCMFSGDDHGCEIGWQKEKELLRRNGADLVFFPYTERVSSTILREQLISNDSKK